MSGINIHMDTHRTWEDWLAMLCGLLVVLSPALTRDTHGASVWLNAVTIGLLILGIGFLEYSVLQRWEEVGLGLLGVWLIISPFAFGYANEGELRLLHSGLGGVAIVLAVLQLWQDWKLTDDELHQRERS